jgi:hypothetical protein
MSSLVPVRTVEEIVGGQVPIMLGRTRYVLPELPMAQTDAWAESMDERLRGLLSVVDTLDEGQLMPLFEAATSFQDELLESLVAYDSTGVLPSIDDIRGLATHTEVLLAALGVWSSTKSPLAGIVVTFLSVLPSIPTGSVPKPTSGSRKRSASRRPKSAAA